MSNVAAERPQAGGVEAQWPRIGRQIVAHDRLDAVRSIIQGELQSVHQDYFRHLDYRTFVAHHVYPDSRALLMVQHRAIFRGILSLLLKDDLVALAEPYLGAQPKFFTVAFVRVASPEGGSRGQKRLDDHTFSPLHWDNYHDLPTLTFWIPLNDIDASTGGLVWTHDPTVISMSGEGMSPETYHREGRVSQEFIQLLKTRTVQVNCQKGDVVYFDRTLLHGSSYSTGTPRMTVDLRLVGREAERARSVTRSMRSHILDLDRVGEAALQSFRELMRLGDVVFTRRHQKLRRQYWLHGLYPWVGATIGTVSWLYLGVRRRMRLIGRTVVGSGR